MKNHPREISIIIQVRKTLLFNENESWVKKSGNKDFNVLIGCFDGAEVFETVGTYMFAK